MSAVLDKLRSVFAPAALSATAQRAECIARRASIRTETAKIAARIKACADEGATLATAADALASAEAAHVQALTAVEIGQQPDVPLEALETAVRKARETAAQARQRLDVLSQVQTQLQARLKPLHEAQLEIRREMADLGLRVLDEQLAESRADFETAASLYRTEVQRQRKLRLAFDALARAQARGEFRASVDFEKAQLSIPEFTLGASGSADAFERGAKLTAAHEAWLADERALQREVDATVTELVHGE